jgi:hypothetical protein
MPNFMDTHLGLTLHLALIAFGVGLHMGRAQIEKRYRVGRPQDRDWNGFLLSLLVGGLLAYWEKAQQFGWVSFGPHGRPLMGLLLGLPPLAGCLFFLARMLYQVGVFNRSHRAP